MPASIRPVAVEYSIPSRSDRSSTPASVSVLDRADHPAQRPAEPIESDDHHSVAGTDVAEQRGQPRPVVPDTDYEAPTCARCWPRPSSTPTTRSAAPRFTTDWRQVFGVIGSAGLRW